MVHQVAIGFENTTTRDSSANPANQNLWTSARSYVSSEPFLFIRVPPLSSQELTSLAMHSHPLPTDDNKLFEKCAWRNSKTCPHYV